VNRDERNIPEYFCNAPVNTYNYKTAIYGSRAERKIWRPKFETREFWM